MFSNYLTVFARYYNMKASANICLALGLKSDNCILNMVKIGPWYISCLFCFSSCLCIWQASLPWEGMSWKMALFWFCYKNSTKTILFVFIWWTILLIDIRTNNSVNDVIGIQKNSDFGMAFDCNQNCLTLNLLCYNVNKLLCIWTVQIVLAYLFCVFILACFIGYSSWKADL